MDYPVSTEVLATTWLNREDEPTNGRHLYLAAPGAPTWHPGFGRATAGISVPWRSVRGESYLVARGSRSILCPVLDVGPWSTMDPWYADCRPSRASHLKGERVVWYEYNQAWIPGDGPHSLVCNGASVDLTPLAVSKLLDISELEAFDSSLSLLVTIQRVS